MKVLENQVSTFENYFDILNSSKLQSNENTLREMQQYSHEPVMHEHSGFTTRNAQEATVTFSARANS